MIQLAGRFLLFQKDSALVQWFEARTADGRKKATRKTMIVALARKLLIALWAPEPGIARHRAAIAQAARQDSWTSMSAVSTPTPMTRAMRRSHRMRAFWCSRSRGEPTQAVALDGADLRTHQIAAQASGATRRGCCPAAAFPPLRGWP
ncbi:hypothetical protein X727_33095 [Mesorhizobium sp. L103C119B0]|nr:hypothetical protein X727_33095 [Mesorhizobium sp. L103C119B0]